MILSFTRMRLIIIQDGFYHDFLWIFFPGFWWILVCLIVNFSVDFRCILLFWLKLWLWMNLLSFRIDFPMRMDSMMISDIFYQTYGSILPYLRIDCIFCSLTSNLFCANKVNDYRKCGAYILWIVSKVYSW